MTVLARLTVLLACVCVAGSVTCLVADRRMPPGLLLAAVVLLVVAVYRVVATAAPRPAAVVACCAGVAQGSLVLSRLDDPDPLGAAASVVFTALPSAAAGGVAAARRVAAGQRERRRQDARREERLALARDLHDFVAHDVTAIVVRAQAAQVARAADVDVLRAIEQSGQRALAAMDRAIGALRDAGAAPAADLSSLPTLTERFADGVSVEVEQRIEPGALAQLAPAVSAVGYRVAVEALTNVSRHAPEARRVALSVARAGGSIELVVRNDAAPGRASSGRSTGGSGLAELRAELAAVGATLVVGPTEDRGWELRAVLPVEAP